MCMYVCMYDVIRLKILYQCRDKIKEGGHVRDDTDASLLRKFIFDLGPLGLSSTIVNNVEELSSTICKDPYKTTHKLLSGFDRNHPNSFSEFWPTSSEDPSDWRSEAAKTEYRNDVTKALAERKPKWSASSSMVSHNTVYIIQNVNT